MRRTFVILAGVVLLAACTAGAGGSPRTLPGSVATAAPSAKGSAVASAAASGSAAATTDPIGSTTATPIPAAFTDITLTGHGKKVAEFTIPEDEPAIALITHTGTGTFSVRSIDARGEHVARLVDTVGDYEGTILFDAEEEAWAAAFVVETDGAWAITIKPVSSAPSWDPTTPLHGTEASVYRVVPPIAGIVGSNMAFDIAYDGKDHFVVHTLSLDGVSGLADAIGHVTERVGLPDSTFVLAVDVNAGSWSITPV